MLRYFKSPAPVREISIATIKGFAKPRLMETLKNSIMDNLPMEVKQKKIINRLDIN
jgi:LysR family transcriptional regulator, hydrogen peroxide-inducible genes activator